MTILKIPTPLRAYADGAKQIDVEGNNVGLALEELTNLYPALKTHLFDEAGELRAFVNIFLNEEDVRYLQGKETLISNDDQLMIIPSIAGGA